MSDDTNLRRKYNVSIEFGVGNRFNSTMKEGQGEPVVIPDTDKETLDLFLSFVYSGKLAPSLSLDTYLNLLDLGAKYSVTTLVDCVGTQLCTLLGTDNVVQLLRVADRHNLAPLKNIQADDS